MKVTISNPPFNLKWEYPVFASMQERFNKTVLPPNNNANFAFVLTALNESDKAIFILPQGVLTTSNKNEVEIRKYLVEHNFIEAVIQCPSNMFSSTSVATCILVLNKNKETSKIELINMTNNFDVETREQKGQYGGKSHTNRVYIKKFNVFNDEEIEYVLNCIKNLKTEKDLCKAVTIEEVKEKNYKLSLGIYEDISIDDSQSTRSYEDIVKDLNRVIRQKSNMKLVINEKVAKSLGLMDLINSVRINKKINEEIKKNLKTLNIIDLESELLVEDFITISKKQNEISLINNDKEHISTILLFALNSWKQFIYHLNEQENIYLCELRDNLINDLLSGKVEIKDEESHRKESENGII